MRTYTITSNQTTSPTLEEIGFLFFYYFQMNELKKKITDFIMSEKFQDRRGPINEVDYIDDITKIFYEVCTELGLSVDFDQCDNGSECRIQSTVYVKNMIVDGTNDIGYNIILDCDVKTRFDEREELIETIYNQELHAQKIIQHFNS